MGKEFHKRYYITEKLAKDLTKLASAMYDEKHPESEINNPKPLFEALGIKKPLSMEEKLDRLFRGPRGLIQQMYEQGEETPEEMNDLDIDDDIEPVSPYEYHVMQDETLKKPLPKNNNSAGKDSSNQPDEKVETSTEEASEKSS